MKIALAAFPFLAVQYCFAFVLPEGHPPTQSVFNIEELLHKWQAPGSTDKRSPCPALNALANHGYLNRNGKQLTAKAMQNAMSLVYNLSPAFGDALATAAVKGLSPNGTSIDLDQLQLHGFIEHDASLVHKDSALGPNWIVDKELLDQFISMAQGKAFISQEMVGKFRAIREKDSQLKNPKYVFGPKERAIAYNEAGLLWTTMSGAYGGEAMPVEQVKQFLGDEKIPSAYKRPQKPIGLTDVTKAAQAISEYSQ